MLQTPFLCDDMMRTAGRLIEQYEEMHRRGRYSGGSTLRKHVADITALVTEIPTESILDWGCGKGHQYHKDRLHEAWGIMPTLYDPAVPGINTRPSGTFDGLICTGVLEHIPRDELPKAFVQLSRYTKKWAFISIGCSHSNKLLPNGGNVHCTLKPESWWLENLHAVFGDRVRLETTFIWR